MSFLRIGATIPEYSHILSFRRQVYIAPTESTIPESLVISHGGLSYRIFLSLDSQKCFKCNQSGHIANNCRSTSQPSTSNMDDTVLPSSSVKPNNNMSSSIQLEPTITQAAEVRQTQLPILTEESPNRQTISTPQPILSQSKELNIEMPPTPSVATTDDASNTGKRNSSSSSESLNDPFHCSSDEDPTYQVDEVEAEDNYSESEESEHHLLLPLPASVVSDNTDCNQPTSTPPQFQSLDETQDENTYTTSPVNEVIHNMETDNPNYDDQDIIVEAYNIAWKDPVGNHEVFPFDPKNTGVNPDIAAALGDQSPIDFFSLFIDDEIIQIITDQTNLYASQKLLNIDDTSEGSRLHAWTPINKEEIKKFIGIIGYMGLVKLPTMDRYWTKTKKIYHNSVVGQIMSRNRFELLLNMWHFTDNDMCPKGDRGYKIEPFMNLLLKKFQEAYTPRILHRRKFDTISW
ncbi:unnamed protein product [Acanthoscelides obtectus]|uniref:CCHC-type domain-containing protein n=1 Tax=Acanthoscelides obtectus TaxID=200917 RepID=A0A9P0MBH3_ACAOB|nr:unnamed protein product [Acanthoscelides obtectus]CAK1641297.1 PiggyBac transposable element-derived protein 4 [Acanthoscelides obtectus]